MSEQKTEYLAYEVMLDAPYEEAVEKVTAALKAEGFGVLTRIDVKETLKEKLDEDFRPYVILGACNPPLAHRALQADPKVGVMLPCNVTVETAEDGTRVMIANPITMMGSGDLAGNDDLRAVAQEAQAKLSRVAESLAE